MIASIDEAQEALARRLDLIEDTAAIVDVLYRYCHSIDYGMEDDFVDCFTAEAVWEVHREGSGVHAVPPLRFAGEQQLREFVEGHTRPPELYHKHATVNPLVEVRGDLATARSYIVTIVAAPGGMPELTSFGRYIDLLVRERGSWRISERRVEVEAWNPMWGVLRDVRRNTRRRE